GLSASGRNSSIFPDRVLKRRSGIESSWLCVESSILGGREKEGQIESGVVERTGKTGPPGNFRVNRGADRRAECGVRKCGERAVRVRGRNARAGGGTWWSV